MSRNYRTGTGFARPENALKRAEELENVGQKQAALQALHDVLTNKKNRTWSKTFENIMFKHIDLCVEMKKKTYAKEALMQYRNMCQQVNINSLEEVIKYLLKTAGDKAEEAKGKAAAVTLDVEDLEEDASPEDIMLSYVSVEKSKDRTDRELVTPWFKFLWETYRSILDILRTNPKLEGLYTMTATRAFHFCLQYKRTTEFRRLCDLLRQHLNNLQNRYRENREAQPESFQVHLETRFEQLKVACELELWAEAFRSVEDIQALITLAKKTPKQQMMATYYARLTQIFAVSDSHLYHAYAWLKLFNFSKTYNRNLSGGDLQAMACSVLLSTLSILPYERSESKGDEHSVEYEKDRILKMATILGFTVDSKKDYRNVLSRSALLGSMGTSNIMGLVPVEVRQVFDLLTSDFAPLELCSRLAPMLEKLGDLPVAMSAASPIKDISMVPYVAALKRAAVLRCLKQLSEVYSTLKISTLSALVPFLTFAEMEAVIVDAVKYDFLQLRIDHRHGTLHFGGAAIESDKVKNHISLLAKRFSNAMTKMVAQPEVSEEKVARKAQLIKVAIESAPKDHKFASARKIMIERKKEEAEKEVQELEREEERRRIIAVREAEAMEERRRREEVLRREKERLERELEEKEMEEARAMLEQRKKAAGKTGLKEGEKLDKKALMAEVLTERLKEQQEFERKLAKMAKSMDHLERAHREEEVPFLMTAYDERVNGDREHHNAQQTASLLAHKTAWETDIVERQRLSTLVPDKVEFQRSIMTRREEEFNALQVKREQRIAEMKEQRKGERDLQRRKEFTRRCREQVEARVADIEEEARVAEVERIKTEEAEKRKKLDEITAIQRAREEEIERARKEEAEKQREAASRPSAGARESSYVPVHLRNKGGDGGERPPPAGDRDDKWGSRGTAPRDNRDNAPPSRDNRDNAPPSRERDGGDGGWSKRDEAPSRGQDRDYAPRSSAPPSQDSSAAPPPAAAPKPAASAGGKFVPVHLRNKQ